MQSFRIMKLYYTYSLPKTKKKTLPVHVHFVFCYMYFYLYLSDELILFQLIFIIRSYVVLLHHCSRLGEGWHPSNMLNLATFCMQLLLSNQSFGDVSHICFSFIFYTQIRPLVFSFELFYICHFGVFIADYAVWDLFIVESNTMTYSC